MEWTRENYNLLYNYLMRDDLDFKRQCELNELMNQAKWCFEKLSQSSFIKSGVENKKAFILGYLNESLRDGTITNDEYQKLAMEVVDEIN